MPRKTKKLDVYQQTALEVAAVTGLPLPTGLVDEVRRRHNAHKNPAAVALGRLGGAKGGNARAAALSAKERTAIGKKGAATRWEREKQIAAMLKNGRTTAQIAKKLGLPPHALSGMVKRIKAKTLRAEAEISV
jgi:hypothetical protein